MDKTARKEGMITARVLVLNGVTNPMISPVITADKGNVVFLLSQNFFRTISRIEVVKTAVITLTGRPWLMLLKMATAISASMVT